MKTFASRRRTDAVRVLLLVIAAGARADVACFGTVHDNAGAPVAHAYVALADSTFSILAQAAAGSDGTFKLALKQALDRGYLIVQPPAQETPEGIGVYRVAPRIFAYRGEESVRVTLPRVFCLVLRAYDGQGRLMRWKDFRARGVIGDQFIYAADPTTDIALEATCWPVFDQEARAAGQPRDLGIPALMLPPGRAFHAQVLFWETPGYGKLHLSAGPATSLPEWNSHPGKPYDVINLNVALAERAVAALERRGFTEDVAALAADLDRMRAMDKPQAQATLADALLVSALKRRDERELERARAAIAARPPRTDFAFGVFEGSPYNAKAFATARDAGFNLATVLLGWNWTDAAGGSVNTDAIEQTFGISQLAALGYALKAHGVVWLQDYGILPDRARGMDPDALRAALLAQQDALLAAYGQQFAVWEAMNEPNVTNVLSMPRPAVHELFEAAAKRVNAYPNLVSLVNSAHEGDYGRRFAVYTFDNVPVNDWNRTYLQFLHDSVSTLDDLDAVGLQYYPGFHFNPSFGGLEGPATTPSWLVDTIERYAVLGRPIHITEFSVPSAYGADWTAGYWREPWTESTQADYAEYVFTLAYADPNVTSITWWDVTDAKSSVAHGGLCRADGSPKPVLNRLQTLLNQWKQR